MLYQLSYASPDKHKIIPRWVRNRKERSVPTRTLDPPRQASLVQRVPIPLYPEAAEKQQERRAAILRFQTRYALAVIAAGAVAAALVFLVGPRLGGRREIRPDAGFECLPAGCLFAVHANLAALRSNPLALQLARSWAPGGWETDYAEFVRATGFDFERDTRWIAIGVSGGEDARVTDAVIDADFDHARLDAYMAAQRKQSELYEGRAIDTFHGPSSRLFRLAFRDARRLLFSNAPASDRIRTMVQLGTRGGDSLARRFKDLGAFEHVPAGSQVWLGADLERGASLRLPISPGSDTSFTSDLLRGGRLGLISVRLDNQRAELRLLALYGSQAEARHAADSLAGLRALLRLLAGRQSAAAKGAADFARALDAIAITTDKNAAVATWPVNVALLKYLFGGARNP